MGLFVHFSLLTLCLVVVAVNTSNPGFRMKITSQALQYANNVAMDELSKSISSASIPDFHGSGGKFKYDITSIKINSFSKPSSQLVPEGDGIRWTASNAGISMGANFHYEFKEIIKISDHGSITADVSGLSFSVVAYIGRLPDGKPSCKAVNCNANIGHLGVKFHGGRAFIYNLFKGKVADSLKKSLEPKICESIVKLINVNGQQALAKLKMTANLGPKFVLDYSLNSDVIYNSNYVETNHKGEVFWHESTREANVPNPQLPVVTDNSKMIYFWLSEYAISTLMWQAQNNNFLAWNFTRNDLDPGHKDFLDITCESTICIGNFIPQLQEMYPGYYVEMYLQSSFTPKVNIMAGKIHGELGGKIDLYAVKNGSSDRHFICRFSANMSADAQMSIKDELLLGHMNFSRIQLKVEKSTVQLIPQVLTFALNTVVQTFVDRKVNNVLEAGVPLPVKGKIRLTDPKLQLLPHAAVISSNLQYV